MNLVLASNMTDCYNVGDTIPGAINNGVMDALSSGLLPKVESMIPKLDSILVSLNAILASDHIPSTLSSLDATMHNMKNVSANLDKMMRNDVPALMATLNTVGDNATAITNKLSKVDFQETFDLVDSTLANVTLLTDKLKHDDNSLGLLLNDRKLYDNLNSTAENASNLLYDLKAHPKRYVHFSLFGKKEK